MGRPTTRLVARQPEIAGPSSRSVSLEGPFVASERVAQQRAPAPGLLQAPTRLAADAGGAVFPYRYAGLDPLLARALPRRPTPAQAAAISDLGALLTLAAPASQLSAEAPLFPNAGEAAFAVLRRAAAAGGCLPHLNLAFLLAASHDSAAEQAFPLAEAACPNNPTALWLHGEWLSIRAPDARDTQAATVFRHLERVFPRSAAGWSGEADVLVRHAYFELDKHSPFNARHDFATALSLYLRAAVLDRDPGLQSGVARALDGIGKYAAAARAQARAALAAAPLEAGLVVNLEHAGQFAAAAEKGLRVAAAPRYPSGPGLFMGADAPAVLHAQDALGPLSLGAGRLRPVTFDIAPFLRPGTGDIGPSASVEDLSFVPSYRQIDGVTGNHIFCPAWAARRDLILAGAPARALKGMPNTFPPIGFPSGTDCVSADATQTLRAVAEAELSPAVSVPPAVYDARQDL